MVRTPSRDKSGLRKGTWTSEEDRKLIAYVTRYGCWNWRQLPRFAGLERCGKSCRLRWMNYLRPNIKRGNYTQEEEEIIIRLHAKLGNRWSTIAAHLPGRTDNEIKNHWHTTLKKRFQQNAVTNEEAKASKSKDNESKPEERELVPKNDVFQVTPPATSQISDSASPLSLLSPSITSDHTTAASNKNSMLEDDFAFLDAYTEPVNGTFWTEPYVGDNSNAPSEMEADHGIGEFKSVDTKQIPAGCALMSPYPALENDFAFLDSHTEPTMENFWSEPYMSDVSVSHVPSQLLTPLVTHQSDYFSPVYGPDLWSRSNFNLYDQHIRLFQ